LFEIAEYIGLIAFAMSGFFVAVRNRLDLLGVLIATFLTALGGGIIRDVIVDRVPYTFTNNLPAFTVFAIMILLIIFKFHKKESIENRFIFILSDSIGLVSFSITGALIALDSNFNFTGVLALSFITAVGGGIIRDTIINEVPFVFKTGFYGTISLLIGGFIYFLNLLNYINFFSIATIFVFGVVLRIIAYYKKWSIPLI
jgi:uncharacterized membrane protein YeiH